MKKRCVCLGTFLLTFFLAYQASALTADQVLALKKAGVSDRTIQLMIQQETAARQPSGGDAVVREIKDKNGNVVILYSTGDSTVPLEATEQENVSRAWDMLHRVIIDGRK